MVEAATRAGQRRARVRVRLVTGRRNQIRVQFAACGWPLLGDRFYGARDPGPGRTALHAARLGFLHPTTGAEVSFESDLPPDLATLDRRLFS
jgi:23S rRNA pseudouridine1911/1915/1917 synthase